MIDLIVYWAFIAAAIILITWLVWIYRREKVFLKDGRFCKKYQFVVESLEISELTKISYHYHAVVGFVAIWELVDSRGNKLVIDGRAKGVWQVMSELQHFLPEFTLKNFDSAFASGDVVETIEIWQQQ
ncbi:MULTISPECIES: hypothetical protein [Pseudoalteromonas]|uniref:Uncharacterized protein n=1 Tax=Pseudoalteromonas obscura TaxID=3048491 RepID=A0ABT7EP11_9GAMM|nr:MULTISPECIES: hypothetical protein [Pseudoalteromonas]MBQ4834903.1 hypothetical protein [Pseudoalteromonas luteoviolacea]MDK2596796.1 hypothetical protein [Pseudoalteromonas sp. P94(2023)]